MTLEPSPLPEPMTGGLMSCAADSPARTLASPDEEQESTVSVPACGLNTFGSFAYFDPASSSWKTWERSLFEGSIGYSGTWPRSGMTRSGIASALTSWGQLNIGSVSGWWHTPTTRDYKGQSGLGNRTRRGKPGKPHVANLCDQIVDLGRPDLVRSVQFREWLMGYPIGWTDLSLSETL